MIRNDGEIFKCTPFHPYILFHEDEILNNVLCKIHDLKLQENPNKTQISNLNNEFNFLKLLYKVKPNKKYIGR